MQIKRRTTKQKKIILEELRKVRTHPTADELFKAVRRRLPKVSLATVYRNLEQLSSCGEIQKIEGTGIQKRFDGFADDHMHIRCTGCGKVFDLQMKKVPDLENMTDASGEFEITGYNLEFSGLCSKCRKKS